MNYSGNWTERKLKDLAAKVPDDLQPQVERLATRVKQLNQPSLKDFGDFLSIFDNQDNISQLKWEVDELKDKSMVAEKRMDYLQKRLSKIEEDAVLRQIAINVEYEVKLTLLSTHVQLGTLIETQLKLQLLGLVEARAPASVEPYKYGYGKRKGLWHDKAILELKLKTVEEIAKQVDAPGVESLLTEWYGGDVGVGRQIFADAMRALKRFSTNGAHPVDLGRNPVTVETAHALVLGSGVFSEGDDEILKQKAIDCIRRLGVLRAQKGDGNFLHI